MKFPAKAWDSYKTTPFYRNAESRFFADSPEKILEIIKSECITFKHEDEETLSYLIGFFFRLIEEENKELSTFDDYEVYYQSFLDSELEEDDGTIIYKRGNDKKWWIGILPILSTVLSFRYEELFFPYYFTCRFDVLKRIYSVLDMDMPTLPHNNDIEARFHFYYDLCLDMYELREKNGLTMDDLIIFLYDFMPNHYLEDNEELPMPLPAQAWFIGGAKRDYEILQDTLFWQSNEETRKGDILVFYEKAPVKSITSIWRATSDGMQDPLFYYGTYAYIGKESRLTNTITYEELKSLLPDNKLIKKNLQGINGYPITFEEYGIILDTLKAKGEDISVLPAIESYDMPKGVVLDLEKDVSYNLLIPLLKKIGITNYNAEFAVKTGRETAVRPDFVVDVVDGPNPTARITFEVKYHMKNNLEIQANFRQGESYARQLASDILVICDKHFLQVHKKGKNGIFESGYYNRFSWTEAFGNRFGELKVILL